MEVDCELSVLMVGRAQWIQSCTHRTLNLGVLVVQTKHAAVLEGVESLRRSLQPAFLVVDIGCQLLRAG